MTMLLQVLAIAVAVVVAGAAPLPVAAQQSAAVLLCDLVDSNGPTARALDLGNGGSSRIRDIDDVVGGSCAQAIAELTSAGLEIREFLPVGPDHVAIFALDPTD